MGARSLIATFIILLASPCSMSQESRQLADESAVTFLGATSGASFQVDDSELMPLGQGDTRYVIDSGPHVIRVYQDGLLVVQEKIYASPGQTVEVRIR